MHRIIITGKNAELGAAPMQDTARPKIAIIRHITTGQAVHIKEGERGFWPIYGDLPDSEIAAFNTRHGITPAQLAAMEAGSIFGFDCPAAAPQSYDANGKLKP